MKKSAWVGRAGQRRRGITMTDRLWNQVGMLARGRGVSISEIVRLAMVDYVRRARPASRTTPESDPGATAGEGGT